MERTSSYAAVLTGVALGAVYWVGDSFVDAVIFDEGTFVGQLFSPELGEIWIRMFVLVVLVGFSLYSNLTIKKLNKLSADLARTNAELAERAEKSTISYKKESDERRQTEKTLLDLRKMFEDERAKTVGVIEGLGVGVIIQDLDYMVLYENRFQQQIAGNHVGEYCYKAYADRGEICEDCPIALSFSDGGVHVAEREEPTPDGTKYFELIASPLRDAGGDIIGGIKVVRNITRLKELEDRVLHAHKMETIGALSSGISHEYNNILSIMKGACEFLEEDIAKDSPLRRYVDVIHSSVDRGQNLTQGLLTYSRKHSHDPEPVKVNAVIRRTEALLQRIIGANVELTIYLTEENPVVMADDNQIEQVLINLVTNARDAMPHGGKISISTDIVDVDGESAGKMLRKPRRYVTISVTDTGAGIEEPMKKRLFEPFFTTKDVGEGTGLGLSMVYGIVSKHGGYIDLHSEPGKGTTFMIYLPVYEPEQ
jgi:signal transduction histidine kinase